MTSGKIALTTVTTIALAGAIAAGVMYGPRLMHRDAAVTPGPTEAIEAPAPEPAKTVKPRHAAKTRTAEERAAEIANPDKHTIAPDTVPTLAATEPELHARLKPVLNRGAKMDIAAEGFKDGEQFAAVAHGARNTEIPFMVLKHRVVDEGKTLAQAIEASRPDLDGAREARRAYDAARFDIAAISG